MSRSEGVPLRLVGGTPESDMDDLSFLSNRGIICLSTIDWDFLWQRQQELMTRLADAGVPVLYVEPLGIRSARLSDVSKIARRVRRWLNQGLHTFTRLAPNLYRLSPFALPFQGHASVDAINRWLVVDAVRHAGKSIGLMQPVLWTFYATRVVLDVIAALDPALVLYDCIDDVTHNPKGVARDYPKTERALLSRAELVLTTSSSLYADKRPFNQNTHFIPPGANIEQFATPAAEAPALAGLPHPRLLFFGGIDERVDLQMLATLARRRREWTLILVGVIRTDITPLLGLPNVFFAGQQSHHDLPAYVQHADILLVPYLVNEYTRHIYPAKIFECLATGKPILATPLPDLLPLAGPVRILAPDEDPVLVVENMLAEDTPLQEQERRAIARQNSWDARLQDIQSLLRQALAAKNTPT